MTTKGEKSPDFSLFVSIRPSTAYLIVRTCGKEATQHVDNMGHDS